MRTFIYRVPQYAWELRDDLNIVFDFPLSKKDIMLNKLSKMWSNFLAFGLFYFKSATQWKSLSWIFFKQHVEKTMTLKFQAPCDIWLLSYGLLKLRPSAEAIMGLTSHPSYDNNFLVNKDMKLILTPLFCQKVIFFLFQSLNMLTNHILNFCPAIFYKVILQFTLFLDSLHLHFLLDCL